MSYANLINRTWEQNVLFSALLELTYRCNLDCDFCYNDLELRGRTLLLEDYRRLLQELAELGTLQLTLTGGEPLAHPDFFAIGAEARRLGFQVRIKSNGHALRGALLRRLIGEVDPYAVDVSLHGASAAVHDRQTRVAGSFERLVANLAEMRGAGLRLKLNATLTCWNEHELEGMFALADELGVPMDVNATVTPRDDGDQGPLQLQASQPAVARLWEIRLQRAGLKVENAEDTPRLPDERPAGKQCGAGSSNVAVDPYGNVYPCVQWRQAIGNLHENSLREIWEHSPALEGIRATTQQARVLVQDFGRQGPALAYCAGLAHATTGDPLQMYPQALHQLAGFRQAIRREPADPEPSEPSEPN
ncbi:MAG: radical SAM protein [Gammaproteobacteria bacterium]|nr:radical SAM protein [Gammaproteobacteria bacterium]